MNISGKKEVLLVVILMILPVGMMAQMNDPREKFSISATVDGGSNAGYTWYKAGSDDQIAGGTMKQDISVKVRSSIQLLKTKALTVSLSPFYYFNSQKLATEWGVENLGFDLPKFHHHYGANLMVNYTLQACGKPLTLIGMGSGNFSQYGYENASGMLGAMFTLTRNRRTYMALGAVYLLGTAVVWPLYPMIVLSHKFNDLWSLNMMGLNNYLNYHASQKLKYSVGMELETNKFYFRPDKEGLPERAVLSHLSERFGVFADWKATKSFTFNIGMGVNVPFYCRLQESGYNKSYMDMKTKVKPFLRLKLKYALSGK